MAINITDLYPLSISSTLDSDFGTKYDYSDDGNIRSRDLYSQPRINISASWENIYKTDAASLRSLLLTYRNSDLELIIDDVIYQGRLIGFPKVSWVGGNLQNVTANFSTVVIT